MGPGDWRQGAAGEEEVRTQPMEGSLAERGLGCAMVGPLALGCGEGSASSSLSAESLTLLPRFLH